MNRLVLAASATLLLLPSLGFAQAWSNWERGVIDQLIWIQWNQWIQHGLLAALILAVIGMQRR